MAYTTIVAGTTIVAAWANASVRDQTTSTHASSAARDSAISSPVAGMVAYIGNGQWTGYDGTGWFMICEPRQVWTPTVAWTAGNGTFLAGYQRHDGECDFDMAFTFGSTSSIAGSASITLPFASLGSPGGAFGCGFADASAGEFVAGVSAPVAVAGTSLVLRVIKTDGTYATFSVTSGTIPFTWTTSDVISVSGTFRMNTRYL